MPKLSAPQPSRRNTPLGRQLRALEQGDHDTSIDDWVVLLELFHGARHGTLLPRLPTRTMPGTPGKVAVLCLRAARRESLWHPLDSQLGEPMDPALSEIERERVATEARKRLRRGKVQAQGRAG